jgi:hypothetical protein
MKTGTKSLLIGAHQFIIHPICVAIAWNRLYGFPKDIRLWCAFFLHDIGYFGCSNIDGLEGKKHPYLGANIISCLFDRQNYAWFQFSVLHSGYIAKIYGMEASKLCAADKLAFCIHPKWMYLLGCTLSGEIKEYLNNAKENGGYKFTNKKEWHKRIYFHMLRKTVKTKWN